MNKDILLIPPVIFKEGVEPVPGGVIVRRVMTVKQLSEEFPGLYPSKTIPSQAAHVAEIWRGARKV